MERFFGKKKDQLKESFKIGAEILGEDDPILEALLIYLSYSVLNQVGLGDDFVIELNSIGIQKEQDKYREELLSFYENKKHLLTDEGLKQLEANPMKLLRSSDEDERILAQEAPQITRFLKKKSKEHYVKVKEYLDLLGVSYDEKPSLMAKYNYHSNTVWAFRTAKGKKIVSGARYNPLASLL